MSALRAHLVAMNRWAASLPAPTASAFTLEEDTIKFKLDVGAACGEVSISLEERSSYPHSGGLAFAEGTDTLLKAVETVGSSLGMCTSLDVCLRLLCDALGSPDQLQQHLGSVPLCHGAERSASGSTAPSASNNLKCVVSCKSYKGDCNALRSAQ